MFDWWLTKRRAAHQWISDEIGAAGLARDAWAAVPADTVLREDGVAAARHNLVSCLTRHLREANERGELVLILAQSENVLRRALDRYLEAHPSPSRSAVRKLRMVADVLASAQTASDR